MLIISQWRRLYKSHCDTSYIWGSSAAAAATRYLSAGISRQRVEFRRSSKYKYLPHEQCFILFLMPRYSSVLKYNRLTLCYFIIITELLSDKVINICPDKDYHSSYIPSLLNPPALCIIKARSMWNGTPNILELTLGI